jgi:hypothetical protein
MSVMGGLSHSDDDYYTLLGVRPDGAASVVDLLLASEGDALRHRADALLAEHASCHVVEVWRGPHLVERFERT